MALKRLAPVLVLPLALGGCAQASMDESERTAATNQPREGLLAVDTAGRPLLSVSIDRSAAEVHLAGDAAVQTTPKGWSITAADTLTADRDTIKLKNPAGATTWKVRIGETTTILSGDDDVVCEVTTADTNRYRTRSSTGAELGGVRPDFAGGTRLQQGTGTDLGTSSASPSRAQAALLCTDVPAGPRAVIIAELTRRGK